MSTMTIKSIKLVSGSTMHKAGAAKDSECTVVVKATGIHHSEIPALMLAISQQVTALQNLHSSAALAEGEANGE